MIEEFGVEDKAEKKTKGKDKDKNIESWEDPILDTGFIAIQYAESQVIESFPIASILGLKFVPKRMEIKFIRKGIFKKDTYVKYRSMPSCIELNVSGYGLKNYVLFELTDESQNELLNCFNKFLEWETYTDEGGKAFLSGEVKLNKGQLFEDTEEFKKAAEDVGGGNFILVEEFTRFTDFTGNLSDPE